VPLSLCRSRQDLRRRPAPAAVPLWPHAVPEGQDTVAAGVSAGCPDMTRHPVVAHPGTIDSKTLLPLQPGRRLRLLSQHPLFSVGSVVLLRLSTVCAGRRPATAGTHTPSPCIAPAMLPAGLLARPGGLRVTHRRRGRGTAAEAAGNTGRLQCIHLRDPAGGRICIVHVVLGTSLVNNKEARHR